MPFESRLDFRWANLKGSGQCLYSVAPIREEMLLALDFLQAADVDIRARGSVCVQGKHIESKMVMKGVGYVTSAVCLEKSVALRPNMVHIYSMGPSRKSRPGQGGRLKPSVPSARRRPSGIDISLHGAPSACTHQQLLRW